MNDEHSVTSIPSSSASSLDNARFRYVFHYLLAIGVLAACQADSHLIAYSSQGCATAPDRSVIESSDWCDCCREHDIAYWRGGTKQQRDHADVRLRKCINVKTNDDELANNMTESANRGEGAYFFAGYRWGYGWQRERNFQPLSEKEVYLTNQYLLDYFKQGSQACQ